MILFKVKAVAMLHNSNIAQHRSRIVRSNLLGLARALHLSRNPVHKPFAHNRIAMEEAVAQECYTASSYFINLPVSFQPQPSFFKQLRNGFSCSVQLPFVVMQQNHIVHVAAILAVGKDPLFDLEINVHQHEISIPMGYRKSNCQHVAHARQDHPVQSQELFIFENSAQRLHNIFGFAVFKEMLNIEGLAVFYYLLCSHPSAHSPGRSNLTSARHGATIVKIVATLYIRCKDAHNSVVNALIPKARYL